MIAALIDVVGERAVEIGKAVVTLRRRGDAFAVENVIEIEVALGEAVFASKARQRADARDRAHRERGLF